MKAGFKLEREAMVKFNCNSEALALRAVGKYMNGAVRTIRRIRPGGFSLFGLAPQ